MIYNNVSSNLVIARVENDFNPDYAGWVGRAPEWIANALDEMEIYVSLEPVQQCIQVSDYKFLLPCDIKLLIAIKYRGERLNRLDFINHQSECDLAEASELRGSVNVSEGYELSNNGWGTTTFESGEITIYYRRIPVEFDNVTQCYFPLIPNKEKVIKALEWYIIKTMLQRGHTHKVYDLASNNPITNPAVQWETAKKAAVNSVGRMDADERNQVSKLMRTLLTNKHYHDNEAFDNIAKTNPLFTTLP